MKSKKGFTLVELMIVIVIMGVLVAVAVPVFGLVTKNAEKKTCGANMDIIAKGAQQCALTDTNSGAKVIFRNDGTTTVDIRTQEDARQAAHRALVIRLACVGAFSALVIALAVVLIRKLHKAGKC